MVLVVRHVFGLIFVLLIAVPLAAAPPQVQFDVAGAVACREILSPDFSAANPGEKLVEAEVEISAFVGHGSEDLVQFVYRFESPLQSAAVADYWPKTTLASDITTPIATERRYERSHTAGLELNGSYTEFFSAKLGAQTTSKDSTTDRYERLPPLALLAASGTTHRGAGVYFKLRPSPRGSLEGAKSFVLLLRVPRTWRGDYLRLYCEALGTTRGSLPPLDTAPKATAACFTLALYQEGDEPAKHDAQRLMAAEEHLRRLALSGENAIRDQAYPTFAHRVGAIFSLVEAKIPADWLADLLAAPPGAPLDPRCQSLPLPLRRAAAEYRAAKQQIGHLAG